MGICKKKKIVNYSYENIHMMFNNEIAISETLFIGCISTTVDWMDFGDIFKDTLMFPRG